MLGCFKEGKCEKKIITIKLLHMNEMGIENLNKHIKLLFGPCIVMTTWRK